MPINRKENCAKCEHIFSMNTCSDAPALENNSDVSISPDGMRNYAQHSGVTSFKSPDTPTWSMKIQYSSRHPKVHRNISEAKSFILFQLENFLCPVALMTRGSFQFCSRDITVRVNVTENSFLNLSRKLLEILIHQYNTHTIKKSPWKLELLDIKAPVHSMMLWNADPHGCRSLNRRN